jgi:hypothetical protein
VWAVLLLPLFPPVCRKLAFAACRVPAWDRLTWSLPA